MIELPGGADFGVGVLGERGLAVEDEGDERKLGLVQDGAAAGPVVVKRLVQALEEAADPAGIGGGGVVVNQVVLGLVDLEAGELGGELFGELVAAEGLERTGIGAAVDEVFLGDGPEGAVARQEHDAAIFGFDFDFAGDFAVGFALADRHIVERDEWRRRGTHRDAEKESKSAVRRFERDATRLIISWPEKGWRG